MGQFTLLQLSYSQRVDVALATYLQQLPFEQSALIEAMRYGTLLGGKRLRPFLVYATGSMCGTALSVLDPIAAAIECIHAYSLIHDDLPAMDNDDLRRGQPTCHIKFGEATAILAGDSLLTLAFSILADQPMLGVTEQSRIAIISELARASGAMGMCAGQALDLDSEQKTINLSILENIHHHKTGALIRAAVHIGALSAGEKSKKILPQLDQFAQAIGLAFQVQDDILDVIGDTAKTGKRQGADIQQQKSTYPTLLGIEGAQKKAWSLYQNALTILENLRQQSYNTESLELLAHFIVKRDN